MADTLTFHEMADFPLKWNMIMFKGLFSPDNRQGFFPDISQLRIYGLAPHTCMRSVIINPSLDQLDEMRHWLKMYSEGSYRLFGRFRWLEMNFQTVRHTDGLCLQFLDDAIACHFKLAFG